MRRNRRYFNLLCLLNTLFSPTVNKIQKLRITGCCAENPPMIGGSPHSEEESVFLSWSAHGTSGDITVALNEPYMLRPSSDHLANWWLR